MSDFGLCWGIGEERLTGLNERVGPYKIMPPELEKEQIKKMEEKENRV